jgi:hypothetical protein
MFVVLTLRIIIPLLLSIRRTISLHRLLLVISEPFSGEESFFFFLFSSANMVAYNLLVCSIYHATNLILARNL